MSRRIAAPESADDVLDTIVRTMGREAQRLDERSKKKALKPREVYLLIQLGGAVTKVVAELNSPFSGSYQARLRRMTDAQLEAHKRDVQAIEGQVVAP